MLFIKNRKFASALRTDILNQALYWKIEEERGCHYSVRQRYHCNEFPNIGPALSATLARFALYTGGERVLLHKSWIAQKRFIRSSIVEWSFKITPSVVHFFKICVLQFIFDCNIRDTHCALVVFIFLFDCIVMVKVVRRIGTDICLFISRVISHSSNQPRGRRASANIEICQISANIFATSFHFCYCENALK